MAGIELTRWRGRHRLSIMFFLLLPNCQITYSRESLILLSLSSKIVKNKNLLFIFFYFFFNQTISVTIESQLYLKKALKPHAAFILKKGGGEERWCLCITPNPTTRQPIRVNVVYI